jgi:hypothetical protein
MLYEYKIKNSINKEQLENTLGKSKILVRNYFNFTILTRAIFLIILMLIVTLISFITKSSIIYIELFGVSLGVIMLSIIYNLLLHHKYAAKIKAPKGMVELIEKDWNENRSFEVTENMCTYICGKFKTIFTKEQIAEIIESKEYTIIFVTPKLLKYIHIMDPVIIPTDLFGSEEEYNVFINSISK